MTKTRRTRGASKPAKTVSASSRAGTRVQDDFAQLLARFSCGVFVVSAAGKVLLANRIGAAFFGKTEAEMLGYDYGVPAVLETDQEIPIIQLDGTLGAAEVRAMPARWREQSVFVVTMRDITEQVRWRSDMQRARQRAESTSLAKSEFIAGMSHELKTPLNSILVLSELLAENNGQRLSDKEVTYAQTIYMSGQALLRLVSDVLDIAKIEAGRMVLHDDMCDVRAFVDNLSQLVAPLALVNRNAFRARVSDAVPTHIRVDAQRLEQILRNLLANAFHFTHDGTVELLVDALHDAPEAPLLSVRVVDTGIGIPAGELAAIFEGFGQVHGDGRTPNAGTGLGLTLSQKFAEALGGRIHVASREGVGSTFELRMPLRVDGDDTAGHGGETAALTGDTRPAERALLQGRAVLLVSDNMREIFALSQYLETAGASVTWAEDAAQTLVHLQSGQRIDAICLDMQMTLTHGLSLLSQVRSDRRFHTIPIVAVSTALTQGEAAQCQHAGATECLFRPVTPAEVAQRLHHWMVRADGMQSFWPVPEDGTAT